MQLSFAHCLTAALILLTACIKLEERQIKLATDCPNCIRMIRDSLNQEKGVYWIDFQPQTRHLTIKYDTSQISGEEVYWFLAKKGLVRTTKEFNAPPDCCKE
ncbi:MAG: heavy-metal-associated domain-containing protein [Cytophagales bacterium]|nr:heavy-metal-associated domain-containing protein [Bernardetiaceae bacterium]MDW8211041.1 heavy-metal-associated domain-containing protein [Cytophagales bacterium]